MMTPPVPPATGSPNGQPLDIVYLPAAGLQAVAAYSVNPGTGALQPLPGSPYPTRSSGDIVVTPFQGSLGAVPFLKDRQNRFLYFADLPPSGQDILASDINGFDIAKDGTLHTLPGLPANAQTLLGNGALAGATPDGRFLYTWGPPGGDLNVFPIDQNSGAVLPSSTGIDTIFAAPMAITSDERFLISLGGPDTPSILSVYALDGDTGLPSARPLSSVDVSFGEFTWTTMTIDPLSRFVFLATKGDTQNLSAFSISPNGHLSAVNGSPFTALPDPTFQAIDPTGQWLFFGSSSGAGISAFHIGSSGALTPVDEAAASNSVGSVMTFDSTGSFLYRFNAGAVEGFRLDPATGILSPI